MIHLTGLNYNIYRTEKRVVAIEDNRRRQIIIRLTIEAADYLKTIARHAM